MTLLSSFKQKVKQYVRRLGDDEVEEGMKLRGIDTARSLKDVLKAAELSLADDEVWELFYDTFEKLQHHELA